MVCQWSFHYVHFRITFLYAVLKINWLKGIPRRKICLLYTVCTWKILVVFLPWSWKKILSSIYFPNILTQTFRQWKKVMVLNNFCERGKFITIIYPKKHFRTVYSNFSPSLKLIISQTFITKILKNKKLRMKYWRSRKCDWNSIEWRDVLFISFPVF